MKTYTIGLVCTSDMSESYQEVDVPLSAECALVGTRDVSVTRSFRHKLFMGQDCVMTVVKLPNTVNHVNLCDDEGNYDPAWHIADCFALENVKFQQGLIIRGTLKNTDYYSNKKYCKKLDHNRELFFTHKNVPVMVAKSVLFDSGSVYARGIK